MDMDVCREGRRREGAIKVQQRCQWSAEKARVTSALRLYDVTKACLSLHHGSAKGKRRMGWCSRKRTSSPLTQESLTPFSTSLMRKPRLTYLLEGTWPGDFCTPRIFAKATCNAFTPAQERLEQLGRCHALGVEECSFYPEENTPKSTTGHVDDFACHFTGAGVPDAGRTVPVFREESPTNPAVPIALETQTMTTELVHNDDRTQECSSSFFKKEAVSYCLYPRMSMFFDHHRSLLIFIRSSRVSLPPIVEEDPTRHEIMRAISFDETKTHHCDHIADTTSYELIL